jgi:hypothetical protein
VSSASWQKCWQKQTFHKSFSKKKAFHGLGIDIVGSNPTLGSIGNQSITNDFQSPQKVFHPFSSHFLPVRCRCFLIARDASPASNLGRTTRLSLEL